MHMCGSVFGGGLDSVLDPTSRSLAQQWIGRAASRLLGCIVHTVQHGGWVWLCQRSGPGLGTPFRDDCHSSPCITSTLSYYVVWWIVLFLLFFHAFFQMKHPLRSRTKKLNAIKVSPCAWVWMKAFFSDVPCVCVCVCVPRVFIWKRKKGHFGLVVLCVACSAAKNLKIRKEKEEAFVCVSWRPCFIRPPSLSPHHPPRISQACRCVTDANVT